MNPNLQKNGYVIVPNFLDPMLSRILYNVFLLRHWRGEHRRDDFVPEALSYWNDSTLDAVLVGIIPNLEKMTGCRLLPTYSYARFYLNGQSLPRHHDREACEIVTTIHLGSEGGAPPPICFAPSVSVSQNPGDAVVFFGEIEHWRAPFSGDNFVQIFMNYVRAEGDRQKLIYDGRENVFPPALRPSHSIPTSLVVDSQSGVQA